DCLLLGALFNPHPKFLHRKMIEIKDRIGWKRPNGKYAEIKYNICGDQTALTVATEVIDAFFESTSWYRCIAIDQKNRMDLNRFGGPHEGEEIKKARAYKKFAELLLAHNTENIVDGVLLTDELTRCKGDLFHPLLHELFATPNANYSLGKGKPTLKHIDDVKSDVDHYQVSQVNDLLTGCVLNNLCPPQNKKKIALREHLIQRLGRKNLLEETWGQYSKGYVERNSPKFNIWYWKPSK
ncbi:MAG TPA: hypothetical protein VFN94_09645, partial [Nitrospiria bacterium]|nr:hypothetical protein [Nitrospiria bacterium]